MKDTNQITGNLSMLMFALITALSSIFIHDTNQHIPALLSAFYAFLFCLIVYSALALGLFKKLKAISVYWFDILVLNLTTAICWIFTFLALKYIPAELFLFIYLCAMPIASAILFKKSLLSAAIFTLALICLSLTYHVDDLHLGFGLAFLGGFSGTIYTIYSKRIAAIFTTAEILSLRFYLIVVVTFALNIYLESFHILSSHTYFQFAVLSLLSVILPIIFFQIGVKHLSLNHSMAYLPFAPLLCYFINIFVCDNSFEWLQLSAVICLFGLMVVNFTKRGQQNEGIDNRRKRGHWLRTFKLFTFGRL